MEVVEATDFKEYAEVIIDTRAGDLDRPFHYTVPDGSRDSIEIGSLVLVPFRNRLMLGYVVGFPQKPDVHSVKSISRLLDEPPIFDSSGQQLCRWIADRYLCSLAQAFRLVMPPGRSRKVRQVVSLTGERDQVLEMLPPTLMGDDLSDTVEVLATSGGTLNVKDLEAHIGPGTVRSTLTELERLGAIRKKFVLTEPTASPKSRLVVRLLEAAAHDIDKLPPRQTDIMEHLESRGGVEFQSDLLRQTGASSSSLKSLERKDLLEIESEEVLREPRLRDGSADAEPPIPNDDQQVAIDEINRSLEERSHRSFLLEGVTGSGKTEVYLRCIEKVLAMGRSAIVLVPEISLTPQTLERFESRFPGNIAVLHSRLGAGERFDQWRGIRDGRYRVVVGARSAIFAPVSDLGMIAIDEEHESSYKSDTAPRYHARDVAEARARMARAVLILGSATPSLESVQRVRAGIHGHLALPSRIDDRPLPSVEVVDMRSIGGAGEVPLVSAQLLDALSRTVEAGEQAILFLNRRGFANYMQCRACGLILGCDECEVSLCYHRRGNMLMCHHCAKTWDVPPRCPACGEDALKQYGAGTQRVEDEVKKHLPGIPTIRMDTDTTRKKDAHWHLLGSFRKGDAQILIGTQMIAKGLDIPGVTLVGVINADTALALPDFRASERTYQLLTQVSGRAGRGLKPGRVIIQTYNPEHPTIRALTGDLESFIDKELEVRRGALYPPFVELINVLITSADLKVASRTADRMRHMLESDLHGAGATILGPAPAPLARIRGSYRWHILIKCGDLGKTADKVRSSQARLNEYARSFPQDADVRVTLDVDPGSLL